MYYGDDSGFKAIPFKADRLSAEAEANRKSR